MNIPFAQVCFIQIKVDDDDRKTVTLVTGELEMETERELTTYFVVEDSPSWQLNFVRGVILANPMRVSFDVSVVSSPRGSVQVEVAHLT